MSDNIIPSVVFHPGELAQFPLNSNSHPPSQIDELIASRERFSQYRNIVGWRSPADMEVETADKKTITLKKGVMYVLAGNGFHQASIKRQDNAIEVKDYSHLSLDEAILLAETDNAAPLGAQRLVAQLRANYERTQGLYQDDERLKRMFERARAEAGVNGKAEAKDVKPQIDKAGELAEVWGTRVGQIWELGAHRLAVGDCTDKATVEAVMRGERAQACITDPPFNVRDDEWDKFEDFLGFTRNWLKLASSVSGIIASFFPDKFLPLLPKAAEYESIPFRRSLIWVKPPGSQFAGGNRDGYWFDFELIQVYGVMEFEPEPPIKFSVFDYRTITGQEHGAQKPVGVYQDILEGYSKVDGLVYEPFSGTGTNIMASQNRSRRCRAIELDPGYAAVTLERFNQAFGIEPKIISG